MEEGLRELEAHLAKMRERDARLDKESIDDPDTERKNISFKRNSFKFSSSK